MDETMALGTEVASGTQGQTVVVPCVDNMLTATGKSSQNVTCGPKGWTPATLSPCNGQYQCSLLQGSTGSRLSLRRPPVNYSCLSVAREVSGGFTKPAGLLLICILSLELHIIWK